MEIDFFFNDFQFNFLLFFILFAIAYAFSIFLKFKSFNSVIALHAVLISVFSIAKVIDYMFLIFAIVEFVILLKMNSNSTQDGSE